MTPAPARPGRALPTTLPRRFATRSLSGSSAWTRPLSDAEMVARLGVTARGIPGRAGAGSSAKARRSTRCTADSRSSACRSRTSATCSRRAARSSSPGWRRWSAGVPADDVWLQAAVLSMTEAAKAGDSRAAVAADAAFHLAIVATTSSRRLRTAAQAALRELRIVLAVADRVASDLDDLAADHAGLLDALVNAPPPSARAALLDHLRRGESRALAVTHGA